MPELAVDIEAEGARLKQVMDEKGCVSVFVSEGANARTIVEEMIARGEEVKRDAFGHVQLDKVNVGDWFSKRLAEARRRGADAGAEVRLFRPLRRRQRRGPATDPRDGACRGRLRACAASRAWSAMTRSAAGALRAIELPRIKGGKPFDVDAMVHRHGSGDGRHANRRSASGDD